MSKFQQIISKTLGLPTADDFREVLQENIKLREKIKSGVAQAERPQQRSGIVVGQDIPPDMKTSQYLDAYKGWVFACVNVIASEVSEIKLILKRRVNQSEFEAVDSHPVLDLLYKVNPIYTSNLLWESTSAFIELTGEVFWLLVGPVKNPREIWTLRPDWVQIVDSKENLVAGYKYGPPGQKKILIPFESVVHFKDFHPKNPFRGHGVVKASAKAIDTDEFSAEWQRIFFFNSALPGGVLSTENKLTDEQRDRLREDWRKVHQGVDRAWKVAVLESGLSWQDIGSKQKDMDFIEGRRATRDEIISMFRVPKPLLTFDDVNRAAAKEARSILLENVISHKMRRLASFLTEFLLPRYGDMDLFFDIVDPVPNDEDQQLRYYDNALRHGWLSRNEVRELEGREPVEGGESLLVPFSFTPIGSVGSDLMAKQAKNQINKTFVAAPPYPYLRAVFDARIKNIENILTKYFKSLIYRKSQQVINGEVIHKLSTKMKNDDDAREKRWKAIIVRTDDREMKFIHIINRLFIDQRDRLLDAMTLGVGKNKKSIVTKTKVNELSDQVLKETDLFVAPLNQLISTFIEAEGIVTIQSLVDGVVFYMQSEAVKGYLKKDSVQGITAMNENTAELVREQLSEGVEKGESIQELKTRIRDVFSDATDHRAAVIARTEVLKATNFASEEAYRQSGVVIAKEWLTAKDERVCPFCGPLDGKTVELENVFFEEGDEISGRNDKGKTVSMTVSLGNIGHPPLHQQCRCTLIPVLRSGEEKSAKPKSDILKEIAPEIVNQVKKNIAGN